MSLTKETPLQTNANENMVKTVAAYTIAASQARAGEKIILCPPPSVGQIDPFETSSLVRGYEMAHSLLSSGNAVRLIAHGCTLPGTQPSWADSFPDFARTELGAYRWGNPIDKTRVLATGVRQWLDDTFTPATGSKSAGDIFYGSVAGRMLQPLFDAVPYLEGLVAAHPDGEFTVTDTTWPGIAMLRSIQGRNDRAAMPARRRRAIKWRLSFAVAFILSLLRAIAGQGRNYWRSIQTRRFINAHAPDLKHDAKIWLAIVPDWERINRHVLDRIARPLLNQRIPFGLMMVTTLSPGERNHAPITRSSAEQTPWPLLESFSSRLAEIPIRQLVRPSSLARLCRALYVGALASLRIGWRLLRRGPIIDLGGYQVDLDTYTDSLASLATTDVLQVAAVEAAFDEISGKEDFNGTKVIFSSVGLADTAAADRLLHQVGATTINFVHGALGDQWYGQAENSSDHMMVWTNTDMENCRKQGAHSIYFPAISRLSPPPSRRVARNILFVTNHLHQDWAGMHYPLRPFLVEILRSQTLIEQAHPGRFHFAWRPHPSDIEAEVAMIAKAFPSIERSTNSSIDDDLAWADIVILSHSTTMLHALAADRPVFVHCPPAQRSLPEMQALADERKFFFANDMSSPFADLVKALDKDRTSATAPDRELYRSLVGSEKTPKDIKCLLEDLP